MRIRKAAAVLVLLMLVLSACGQDQAPAVDTVQAGLCFRSCEDALTAQYCKALEASLESQGYYVTRADAENDQSRQNEQIADLINRGFDVLVVEPVMVSGAEEIIAQAKAADIPVVFVNREPDGDTLSAWSKACYVGSDTAQPGMLQGQIVLQTAGKGDVNGDGEVACVVIGGPEDHVDTQARAQSCIEALTQGDCQVTLLQSLYGDWTRESGNRLCEKLLSDFGPDIEVVFCCSDTIALGASEALQAAGRTVGQDVYLVGVGADTEALSLVDTGAMTGTVAVNTQTQADAVVTAVKALLAGNAVEPKTYIDYVVITKENAGTFLAE